MYMYIILGAYYHHCISSLKRQYRVFVYQKKKKKHYENIMKCAATNLTDVVDDGLFLTLFQTLFLLLDATSRQLRLVTLLLGEGALAKAKLVALL